MPNEATEALEVTQDTPPIDAASAEETPAPESTPDSQPAPASPEIEKRYNDLRSEFDRRNAALSGQYGPEAQAEALQQFGIELEDEEEDDDDEFPDPLEKVEAIERKLAERDAADEEARYDKLESEYIDKTVRELEGKHNIQLSDKEKNTVKYNALANRLQDDRPDLEGAFADLLEIQSAARDRYLKSKKEAPKAPVGTAGEDKLPTDPEKLRELAAEVYEAEEGANS